MISASDIDGVPHIVVTGASGDIGSYIARYWLARGAQVTCLVRGQAPQGAERVEWMLGSAVPNGVLRPGTVVVHCAFNVEESRNKDAAFEQDVNGTVHLYEEAVRNNVDTFVFLSSANALGLAEPSLLPRFRNEDGQSNTYGRHTYSQNKRAAEAQLFEHSNNAVTRLIVLRPPMVVGPGFHNSALRTFTSRLSLYPAPEKSWYQFIDVADVAHAIAEAIENRCRGVFNVAPDDAINVRQIYDIARGRVLPVPLQCAQLMADVAFRVKLSPFSGHWVSHGDPVLSSVKLQQATTWAPSGESTEVWREFCSGGTG